ncbi:hypothetical protein R1sor_003633 [Riccia sorocarpa]|uniref:NEDD1 n=1 Tax=Riccia sorocarpa TaxID=122646 RepID=A0ABD3H3U9_9MARC
MATGQSLLAACGGETVKLFDPSVETGDPCVFQYTPSPGYQVNCAKWNHTNLVVASAGEDRKISMWMKNGQVVGVVPQPGAEADDSIEESILGICFSSKGSRYLASGGTGQVVRVWDMQRRRCIKWLKGHTDTITGVMYNSRDEHLGSVSIRGDLIIHNLASGTRAAELRDPHEQVLRVLEYSRLSRHLLVTAGDDGSVHIWDTTNRNPKISWLKQHTAPTTGVCFSPCNDKVLVSVGLDKKLYTYDLGVRKPVHCTPFDAPFSSVAFKDDGTTVAAGTNSGRVVFYDIRGKPQPFTVLRAYGSSEAVGSLNWQRSNPIVVIEATASKEAALLGNTGNSEESAIMPDPLPASGNTRSRAASMSSLPGRSASGRLIYTGQDTGVGSSTSSTSVSTNGPTTRSEGSSFSTSNMWTNGSMSRLHSHTPHRFNYSTKDDMEVFSPLVDVQPITPSLSSYYDGTDEYKKEAGAGDASRKASWSQAGIRKFPNIEEKDLSRLSIERRTSLSQEDAQSKSVPSMLSPSSASTPPGVSKIPDSRSPSVTPPELWGGDLGAGGDRERFRQPSVSRFASAASLATSLNLSSGLVSSSRLDSSYGTPPTIEVLSPEAQYSPNLASQSFFSSVDTLPKLASTSESSFLHSSANGTSSSNSHNTVGSQVPTLSIEAPLLEATSLASPRKSIIHGTLNPHMSYSRGGNLSPKQKKSITERLEERAAAAASSVDGKREHENGFSTRLDAAGNSGAAVANVRSCTSGSPLLELPFLPVCCAGSKSFYTKPGSFNFCLQTVTQSTTQRNLVQLESQHGSTSFALQLVQRGLEESLGTIQRAIHDDVNRLHVELLRQFHIQQTKLEGMIEDFKATQNVLIQKIEALQQENQRLRDMY